MALLLLFLSPTAARERFLRTLDPDHGLPVSWVLSVAQDSRGFLWLATPGGVVRYDGAEARPWGRDVLPSTAEWVMSGPSGQVIVVDSRGGLLEVTPDGLQHIEGAEGVPLGGVRHAAFDTEGRLWVSEVGGLLHRDPGGEWSRLEATELGGDTPHRLSPVPAGGMLAVTAHGLWRVSATGPPERLLDDSHLIAAIELSDGTVHALRSGELITRLGSSIERQPLVAGRAIDLVSRRGTLWIGIDRFLIAVRRGGEPELLGLETGFASGGRLLVDREGSLWMGTFGGLVQIPEPDTVIWTERDGLPANHTRYVARSSHGLWVATWGGLARLDDEERRFVKGKPAAGITRGQLCVDRHDRLWAKAELREAGEHRESVVVERDGVGERLYPGLAAGDFYFACTPSADGTVWMVLSDRLFLSRDEGGAPRRIGPLPEQGTRYGRVHEDRHGGLWVASEAETLCRADAERLRAGGSADWSCENVPGAEEIYAIAEADSGDLWLGTKALGVVRRHGRDWRPVIDPRELPSPTVLTLTASPRGGLWVGGHGILQRVLAAEEGWEVVEAPSAWNGLPRTGHQVVEEVDGTLWITGSRGLVKVPLAARDSAPSPPLVRLVEARHLDRRVDPGEGLVLPFDENHLELRFAALSYRDPGRIRYRVRHEPGAPWSETSQPSFRFVDLPPGTYQAEVAASLDGKRWSPAPARFSFRVRPPWYRQVWALALFVLLAAGLVFGLHRARLAVLLRLERQRTRIAMDLHDEMGSGLGSIGLLAGLASEHTVGETDRVAMARKIAGTADELGGALDDIVWSLRSESGSLEGLATHLAERGSRLFPGGGARFDTDFPEDWSEVRLSLAVRRNVHLIAVEALHNAARHAEASRVVLGFAPAGRRWRLWVEDNGKGLREDALASRGLGLESMRRRARDIGAPIAWAPRPGGGTSMEIIFVPGVR